MFVLSAGEARLAPTITAGYGAKRLTRAYLISRLCRLLFTHHLSLITPYRHGNSGGMGLPFTCILTREQNSLTVFFTGPGS